MLDLIRSTLSAMRSPGHRVPVDFAQDTQVYTNTQVYRGFPMASLGSGGFSVSTRGGFENYRMHNNWMQPLHFVPGSFWALSCANTTQSWQRILRQNVPKGHKEYQTLAAIERVTFKGELPHFTQTFSGNIPIELTVNGFSPLTPHAPKTSTLPSALFCMTFKNLSAKPIDCSFLFSWHNILGHGGIGCGGMPKNKLGIPKLIPGQKYTNIKRNTQKKIAHNDLWGLCFKAGDAWGEQDFRHSSMGSHLLLASQNPAWHFSQTECWDPKELDPKILHDFKHTGQVQNSYPHTSKSNAAAICAKRTLEPGESSSLEFQLIWWTPGHVVSPPSQEKNLIKSYTRVGHYYENHFDSAEDLGAYIQTNKETLHAESKTIKQWLSQTSLPPWLQHMLLNASDSATCNSVLPQSGVLHTIEAIDWQWPYGGLTGTADQRLISHPFTASFFSGLDRTEIHSFIKLHQNGSVSHGNGNCDFALESADVPYGRPLDLHHGLKESHWPDLTMSIILQTYRYIKVSHDADYLAQVWPELLTMAEHLRAISPQGVPLGGHTFDTFKIDGVFMYTAGLYLSTLSALKELATMLNAPQREPFSQQEAKLLHYIETQLWEPDLGYYKTSPNRPTLFLGALAGDWFRHWSGIKTGLPVEQARAHIKRQHDILIKNLQPERGRAAFSYMEAFPSGKKKANWFKGIVFAFGYASQVIAYHALEAIQLGLVKEGIETIEHLYKRITRGAYLWSSDLYGNAGPLYMSHTALWALPNALSGAVFDAANNVLKLAPQKLSAHGAQRLPLCFPAFLGRIDWHPQTHQATLHIDKHFGAPIVLKHIEFFNTICTSQDQPWVLESGRQYQLPLDRPAS